MKLLRQPSTSRRMPNATRADRHFQSHSAVAKFNSTVPLGHRLGRGEQDGVLQMDMPMHILFQVVQPGE